MSDSCHRCAPQTAAPAEGWCTGDHLDKGNRASIEGTCSSVRARYSILSFPFDSLRPLALSPDVSNLCPVLTRGIRLSNLCRKWEWLILDAVRHTEEVKIDVRTPDGRKVGKRHATLPIGTAFRIVPAFVATTTDGTLQIRLDVAYQRDAGRYLVTGIATHTTEDGGEITNQVLRTVRVAEILYTAAARCIVIDTELVDGGRTVRFTSDQLSTEEDRMLPPKLVAPIVKEGPRGPGLELVQLVFGVNALTGRAPTAAVARELDLKHRAAVRWVARARAAGLLDGIKYSVGRQANG